MYLHNEKKTSFPTPHFRHFTYPLSENHYRHAKTDRKKNQNFMKTSKKHYRNTTISPVSFLYALVKVFACK